MKKATQGPRRLHYAAPASDSEHGINGWCSIPWTARAVREYQQAGGWFAKGKHNFADRAASVAAGVGE